MKIIDRKAVVVQRMVEGRAIAKRTNANGDREFLVRWIGAGGEAHEVWLPETVVKLED